MLAHKKKFFVDFLWANTSRLSLPATKAFMDTSGTAAAWKENEKRPPHGTSRLLPTCRARTRESDAMTFEDWCRASAKAARAGPIIKLLFTEVSLSSRSGDKIRRRSVLHSP
ncbi:hypothetical protein [Actinomadura chokoriensis]|uniref:Uncharacterized protein n=1 Tax=Actinomadura chokoriensis TaxID=454156 RepID=A0ABV4R4Z4_9ACTN